MSDLPALLAHVLSLSYLHAADPGSCCVEVYDKATGDPYPRLVHEVNLAEGWLVSYCTQREKPDHLDYDPATGEFRTERISGQWGLRPLPQLAAVPTPPPLG